MPLKTKTITADDISITISEASVLMGTRRGVLRGEAMRTEIEDERPEQWLLRVITFPDLASATVETSGLDWPLTFAGFCELSETFVNEWTDAVYMLNPHWMPTRAGEQEKNE